MDISVISEQYANLDDTTWAADSTSRAAIWACGEKPFAERMNRQEDGFVWAKISNIYVYSCYASPNTSIEVFQNFLDRLVNDALGRTPVIIAGDFNAWATEWGSRETNTRGRALLESFSVLDISLVNKGEKFTFCRAGTGSIIDLTFVSNCLIQYVTTWYVSDIYTNSDHQAIFYELSGNNLPSKMKRKRPKMIGWKHKLLDEETLLLSMEDRAIGTESANGMADELACILREACDISMPRKYEQNHRQAAYWWTEEIAELRRNCNQARRLLQRARGRENFESLNERYKEVRRELKFKIRNSKSESWKELCKEIDKDPWGRPYQLVLKKLKTNSTIAPTCPKLLNRIIKQLFPQQPELPCEVEVTSEEVIPPVTIEEIIDACHGLGQRKAPGLDQIPNIALKVAIRARPEIFEGVYNTCLKDGTFPKRWKRQRLVLIPKNPKCTQEASSYRPLCMLDSVGKILEKIISKRLSEYIDSKNALSTNQYGFRKARSTIDALNLVVDTAKEAVSGKRWRRGSKRYCAIVTLDVKNAFNSANWKCILNALADLEVPNYIRRVLSDYLKDRILCYDTEEGGLEYKVTAGVPQGSVLGPILWNIMYDALLRIPVQTDCKIIGFADDVAVTVVAKHKEELVLTCNHVVRDIQNWLDRHGLQLAEHKTEVMLVTSRKVTETITIKVGKEEITSKPHLKYLGVIIDARLTFKEHLTYSSKKAAGVSRLLSRLMPNIGGPRQSRRLLLSSVTSSILLYGAPVWAHVLHFPSYCQRINQAYRISTLRVISGYRTVSNDAAYVISSMPPVKYLAAERSKLHIDRRQSLIDGTRQHHRQHIRLSSIEDWQQEWTNSAKGRWTHKLIPSILKWTSRKHGETDFYLTQLLSGHGCFRSYLFKYKLDNSPNCPSCMNTIEDAEHVFFMCDRFLNERTALSIMLGSWPTVNNILNLMLENEPNWIAVREYASTIIKALRNAEKQRRSLEPP